MSDDRKYLISSAELEGVVIHHGSNLLARPLSHAVGMQRLTVNQNRLPSGQTFGDPGSGEQFLYILQGRGSLRIRGETLALDTGDFIGLSATEPTYQLSNPYAEDLVYLQGQAINTGKADDDL